MVKRECELCEDLERAIMRGDRYKALLKKLLDMLQDALEYKGDTDNEQTRERDFK